MVTRKVLKSERGAVGATVEKVTLYFPELKGKRISQGQGGALEKGERGERLRQGHTGWKQRQDGHESPFLRWLCVSGRICGFASRDGRDSHV